MPSLLLFIPDRITIRIVGRWFHDVEELVGWGKGEGNSVRLMDVLGERGRGEGGQEEREKG